MSLFSLGSSRLFGLLDPSACQAPEWSGLSLNKVGGLWPEIMFAENLVMVLTDGNVPSSSPLDV